MHTASVASPTVLGTIPSRIPLSAPYPNDADRLPPPLVPYPGLPEADWFESGRHGDVFSPGIVALLGLGGWHVPIGARRRRLLNQSTHSRVANSTASSERQGAPRRITSVLNRPMMVSASALSWLSDAADRRLNAGVGEVLGVTDRDVLGGSVVVATPALLADRTN